MTVIQTRGLTKIFGQNSAVSGFDMKVEKGAIYGFIGRNGAGKSTVMKMIGGLSIPTRGDIILFGDDAQNEQSLHRVGTLIESPGLYPHLSAHDNMMLKALALGVVNPKEKINHLLGLVGLLSAGNKKTSQFSMGMKQRLGLALALLNDPDLLLLDEPLNGLDPEVVFETRRLIQQLNKEQGVTILISSHILDHLGKMATHYGVIREGQMVQEMTAEQVAEECSDHLMLQVANPTRALVLLQEAYPSLRFTALPEQSIKIEGAADAAAIGESLNAHNVAVYGLYSHRRDLEEYFVELMGGE